MHPPPKNKNLLFGNLQNFFTQKTASSLKSETLKGIKISMQDSYRQLPLMSFHGTTQKVRGYTDSFAVSEVEGTCTLAVFAWPKTVF
jgi:hypothetical protein